MLFSPNDVDFITLCMVFMINFDPTKYSAKYSAVIIYYLSNSSNKERDKMCNYNKRAQLKLNAAWSSKWNESGEKWTQKAESGQGES